MMACVSGVAACFVARHMHVGADVKLLICLRVSRVWDVWAKREITRSPK